MAIGSDFSINSSTKVIAYTGAAHAANGAGYYTVLELHRWLQDLADDAGSSGDDYMDISRLTPSDKQFDTIITLVNGYTIDAAASEHLYAGSIIQANGDTVFDGIQVIAGSGAHIQVIQNGAVVTNDFWNSVPYGTGLKGLNPDAANGIACRFMLKVRDSAADIDGRRLLLQTREFGYTYTEFKLNGNKSVPDFRIAGHAEEAEHGVVHVDQRTLDRDRGQAAVDTEQPRIIARFFVTITRFEFDQGFRRGLQAGF